MTSEIFKTIFYQLIRVYLYINEWEKLIMLERGGVIEGAKSWRRTEDGVPNRSGRINL